MLRLFFLLFGFGLMTIGFTYIILYLNFLNIEYNYVYIVKFISRRIETYFALIGFIIVNIAIFRKEGRINGIHI